LNAIFELQTEDVINFNNNKFKIIKSKIFLKKSSLYSEFTLIKSSDKKYLKHYKRKNYSNLLTGKNFICEVVNNKDKENKGRIQVKYEIENDKKSDDNFWYECMTPYSSKDTGIFFIPEVGDKVLIYFQSEEFPIALTSIRTNSNEEYFANPNEKFIKNNFGREIHLGENEINIIFAKDENLIKMNENQILLKKQNTYLALEDDKIIIGNENISITFDKDLEIVSKGKISTSSNKDTELSGGNIKLIGEYRKRIANTYRDNP